MSLLNIAMGLFSKDSRFVVVEFNTGGAMLAFFEIEGDKPSLAAYRVVECDVNGLGESIETITQALRGFVRDFKLAGARTVIVIPGQWVFSRFVKLPPVPDDKVAQVIRFEAENGIPFPIDEVAWGHAIIGNKEDGCANVVIASAKDDMVSQCFDVAISCGLNPVYADWSQLCIANVLFSLPSDGCTLSIDLGEKATDLVFVEGEKFFSRSVPIGFDSIVKDVSQGVGIDKPTARSLILASGEEASKLVASAMVRLGAEISRSINFYRSQQGGSYPSRLAISGRHAMDVGMLESLSLRLSVPASRLDLSTSIRSDDDFWQPSNASDASSMVPVAGVALRETGKGRHFVSLIPSTVFARKATSAKVAMGALVAILVLLVVVGGFYCWKANLKVGVEAPEGIVLAPTARVSATDMRDGVINAMVAAVADSAGKVSMPVTSFDKDGDGTLKAAVVSGNVSDAADAVEFSKKLSEAWPGCRTRMRIEQSNGSCRFETTLSR